MQQDDSTPEQMLTELGPWTQRLTFSYLCLSSLVENQPAGLATVGAGLPLSSSENCSAPPRVPSSCPLLSSSRLDESALGGQTSREAAEKQHTRREWKFNFLSSGGKA